VIGYDELIHFKAISEANGTLALVGSDSKCYSTD
jgi:hypothetical protein